MSDLNLELAQDIADQIGAILCPRRCALCSWPLMKFANDPLAFGFCWNCHTSEQTAQKGRDLLYRIKHIEITHQGPETYIREINL